jgi:surface antigen
MAFPNMNSRLAALAVLAALSLAGCSGLGVNGSPPSPSNAGAPAPPPTGAPVAPVVASPLPPPGAAGPASAPQAPPAPVIPAGAALGGVLGGPIGASLTEADREAAWKAQVGALDSGQRRSWSGPGGVFGFVEPGAETGTGCRAYSQTIYIAGRPKRGQGVGCKQQDGTWKMTS